jgi:hypothetical protein
VLASEADAAAEAVRNMETDLAHNHRPPLFALINRSASRLTKMGAGYSSPSSSIEGCAKLRLGFRAHDEGPAAALAYCFAVNVIVNGRVISPKSCTWTRPFVVMLKTLEMAGAIGTISHVLALVRVTTSGEPTDPNPL